MLLRVSTDEALRQLSSIPHNSCRKAIEKHWRVDENGEVSAQSVFWLFCWAKTGMNSEEARQVSARVVDHLLPVSFAELDGVLDHAYARAARYSTRNIESEFADRISQIGKL